MRLVWLICGVLSLIVGAIGAFLPLLPTVPLLLLAAYCFARSSERLQHWLLSHPTLGPPIHDWQERGAIGKRAKWAASLSILAALIISWVLGIKPLVLGFQFLALVGVSAFIWTRPNT